jgi:hypothetical protein
VNIVDKVEQTPHATPVPVSIPHELSMQGTGRRQPKRVATTKKNSKYDDTNYLVDYSGKSK